MSEQDEASKTEEPTPKRLEESRQKGQVIQSRDVSNLIMISAGALVFFVFSPYMISRVLSVATVFFERPHDLRLDQKNFSIISQEVLLGIGFALLVPAILLIIAAIASGLAQFGLIFSGEPLKPKLDKISLIKGLGRVFSMKSVIEMIKGVFKICVISGILLIILWPEAYRIDRLVGTEISGQLATLDSLALRVVLAVIAVLSFIAIADYLYQRFDYMKKMRMTKQEVKDEFRNSEGDPHVKAKLRQIRQERARTRMMANVPTATVVVTNPTHFAVALKYDQTMMAPVVVAKGVDLIAQKIREVARENFVPIVENPPLARSLYATVELDHPIPSEQYKAVAEVIGYVMRLNKRAGGTGRAPRAAPSAVAAANLGNTPPQ